MTLRQFISAIRQSNKLLSSDILLSDRYLANEVRNATNLIVGQQLKARKLWQSSNIFTPIPCLEMEKVPLSECCEYTSERYIAKSKEKLPKIGEGIWGMAIQQVMGLDNMKKFKETTPQRYANLLKLKLTTNEVYYWVMNGHLYVSNPDTESVNFYAFFTEDVPNKLLYPGADCNCLNAPSEDDLCRNPLDKTFYYPVDRAKDIEDIVMERLGKSFLRLREDVTSNNKED